ncbi:hypothetical protein GXW78_09430 [Roseomonas terrae]|jgi:hypothetical protein|uniref:Uncharacterized protein n=1 Tax=Neoroseomonas terrae TaxID=424799 RepID=A0ABS5EFT6_9PROT|nr:hypothetical protein [Neoroseomonas terrae]MBR0649884.1 hypothetical protein [Neoroseomonas terrae]
MPLGDPDTAPASTAFVRLVGDRAWSNRLADLAQRAQSGPLSGRAAQQRHALEFALARAADPHAAAKAGPAERRVLAFAQDAVRLAQSLPAGPRARLRALLAEGLTGEATLIPLWHLLRSAALYRARGFDVEFAGLAEEAPFDLRITRAGMVAEVVCETVSAEEGRPVHRGDWYGLVDRVHPELQTWLAAHPGRYLLKVTLPEGLSGPDQAAELQSRIIGLLAAQKRQDSSADAVLKLDPLVLAGAQVGAGLPRHLRAQFGPEAHLAVTAGPSGGSVFVMAARSGRENAVADAVVARMRNAARDRLTGAVPGILSVFVEDLDRAEWRSLRETLQLEGAVRRFLTEPGARRVVAAACASRMEMFGMAPPDAVADGELRFRNPGHPAGKLPALAPAVTSVG